MAKQVLNSFLALIALVALAIPSVGFAKVEVLKTANAQTAPASLREFIERSKVELLDPAQFPEIFRSVPELEAMIERLHGVQPVTKTLYVLILDRSSPEAYMKQLPSGEAVISITAGLLRFVKNDHELAFVLSHEMEHPNSRLEKNWAGMEHEFNLKEKHKPWAEAMIARTAETETDLRGIYYRMIEAGFNPYAAENVLDRLVDLYGDAFANDHTSTRSRRDAISLAIAAMRRQQGRQISPLDKYDDSVMRPLLDFLLSEEFLERQRDRIKHRLDNLNLDIDSIYEKIGAGEDLKFEKSPYREVCEPIQAEILRLGRYYFSEAETLGYLTAIHARVDEAFVEAHRKFLSSKPKWQSTKQIEQYFFMLHRRFNTFLPDLTYAVAVVIETEDKIKAQQEALKKAGAKSVEALQIESRILALEKELQNQIANREKAKLAFEKIPESLYATFLLEFRKEGHAARRKFGEVLETYRKDLAARYARSLADPEAYLTPEISELLTRYVAFRGYSIENVSKGWSEHHKNKILGEAWSLFAEALGSAFKKASPSELKNLESNYFTSYSVRLPNDTLTAALKTHPKKAMQEYTKLIESILQSDASLQTKKMTVGELVFSINVRLPEETHRSLQSKYVDAYAAFLGETFLQDFSGMNEPERTLNALKSYHRKVLDLYAKVGRSDQPRISAEIYARAKKHLLDRATDHGSVIPENMLILQDSTLLELIAPESRPNKDALWKEFLSLPSGALSPKEQYFRRVSFSSIVGLFDGAIPQAELFSELFSRRWVLEFNGRELTEKTAKLRHVELRREFFKYFRSRESHDFKFASKILGKDPQNTFEKDQASDLRKQVFIEAMSALIKTELSADIRASATKIISVLHRDFTEAWGKNEIVTFLKESRESWMPPELTQRLEIALAFLKHPEPLNESVNPYHPYSDEPVDPNHFLTSEQERVEVSLPLLIEYWKHFSDHVYSRSRATDEIFDVIWRRTENDPRLRDELTDPKLVGNLLFDDTQLTLAEWQLKRFLDGKKSEKKRTGIRPEIAEAREFIKSQIKEANSVRNRLIALLENALLTNEEETRFLSDYRQTLKDPKPSKGALLVDSVHHLTKLAKSNYQKLETLLYLSGRTETPPSYVSKENAGFSITVRRHYWNAGEATRGYAIQSLLDAKEGILSEPATKEQLYEMLLGKNLKVPVIRAMFEAYLDSLPDSEKVVLLSQAVAHLNPKEAKALGLKTILEFMGPLGIKVGQFLRTSGLVDQKTAAELDGFLSRALPPERPEIFSRFRQVFGETMPHIEVGALIGSGSVNYVVLARFHLEGVSEKWVAVRFSRTEAVGQVQNENKIWMNAIQKLKATNDRESLQSADIIEESRAHAMATLSPDGAEFDLEHERNNYGKASKAYGSKRDAKTNLKVTAMKPEFAIQELVPKEFAKSVTVMEYIKHVPLESIEPRQRQLVIEQILQAEFMALFERGLFDPDGHPGNWLNYLLENRLVRIDYAQLRAATQGQRDSLKIVLRILMQFEFSRSDIETLSRNLGNLFNGDIDFGRVQHLIAKLLRSKDFPSNKEPHKRILELRKGIELGLREKGFKLSIRLNSFARAALSSLGRTLGFRDKMMSPDRYQELLLEAIGTSKLKIGVKSVFGKAQKYIRDRLSKITKPVSRPIDCEALLRKK